MQKKKSGDLIVLTGRTNTGHIFLPACSCALEHEKATSTKPDNSTEIQMRKQRGQTQ